MLRALYNVFFLLIFVPDSDLTAENIFLRLNLAGRIQDILIIYGSLVFQHGLVCFYGKSFAFFEPEQD